jgi:hypothetical protein
MIKTHNITHLKYLCYTQKKDHDRYKGSGKLWKRHIKEHGYDVKTEVIYQTESYEEFIKIAKEYSEKYNVVEDSSWANLKIEEGDGGDTVSNKHWITNGVEDKYYLKIDPIPEGWKKGRSNCVFKDSSKQKQFNLRANRNTEKQKEASRKLGLNNKKSLTLNGVTYTSRKEAMEHLNVTKCKLYMMIYDQNRKNK